MADFTKEIFDYIDNNMSEKESKKFINRTKTNKNLKEEFEIAEQLNGYMYAKFYSESIETDSDFLITEEEMKKDVSEFIINENRDKEIINYLNTVFPEKQDFIVSQIKEAEKEAELTGIDKLTEDWVREFKNDKEVKDTGLVNFINSVSYKNKGISKNKKRKIFYYSAASVAAIFIIALVLNGIFNNIPENERIFTKYHPAPTELTGIQVRGANSDANKAFENAIDFYQQGKYDDAYEYFRTAATVDINFKKAVFYSGTAKFEAGKYPEAIQIFKTVISDVNEYETEAKWLISLAYIKMDKYDKAMPYLEDLSKQKSCFQKNAVEIIKDIKD